MDKNFFGGNYCVVLAVFLPVLLIFTLCISLLWTALFFPSRWSYWKQVGSVSLAKQAASLHIDSVAQVFLSQAFSKRLPTLTYQPWQMLTDEQRRILLSKLDPLVDFQPDSPTLAAKLYHWGLGYYPDYSQLTEQWWLAAQAAAPQWSYYYLELAALYREWGDGAAASRMMDGCLANAQAAPHCQSVYPSFMSGEFGVGWFRTEIDE